MDLAAAAHSINRTAYGYISSWALLTACEHRLFDRLPAGAGELTDYPDGDLFDTWMHVLAEAGCVVRDGDGRWDVTDEQRSLLAGDDSYAGYLGGQVLQQMVPRLTTNSNGNVLGDVLRRPDRRRGYQGWFADEAEARAYQESQYAGSLGPASGISKSIPEPAGRVLDLGGGWGAVARAIARRHGVPVDVVDLATVVESAPPVEGLDDDGAVEFLAGSALDPATWPDRVGYDGAVLSYLLSSIPGHAHETLIDAIADREVRWIAVHDFMIDGGSHAAAWSLQHAVFVPGHRSRSVAEIVAMLEERGYDAVTNQPLVDEMTTLVVGVRR